MPKGIFRRYLDISSVLLLVKQVPLLTPLDLYHLQKLSTLYFTGETKATLPQTSSRLPSEVSNYFEEIIFIQLLLHISAYTFFHQ